MSRSGSPVVARACLWLLVVGTLAACSSSKHETQVLAVPADYPTIQAAVDAADSGDVVLIDPGTYNEAVVVSTKGLIVRGTDRNAVVIDGGDEFENGVLVQADDVAVENLTIRRFTVNGLLFSKAYLDTGTGSSGEIPLLTGFRARYITAANNGLYGIYAFNSTKGLIEHVYASGHPDSGVYVGQCKPCDTVVRDATAENNAIGYEGTNASDKLFVIESRFVNNRIGMTPNTQRSERLAPQGHAVIAANLVADNNNPDAPATKGGFGIGIAVGGGTANEVRDNHVTGNITVGIIVDNLEDFAPSGNRVTANVLENNGVDLSLGGFTSPPSDAAAAAGNCFSGNTFTTSVPREIEALVPCDSDEDAAAESAPAAEITVAPAPPDIDYRDVPLPAEQPTMPATELSKYPAVGKPPAVVLDTLHVPTGSV